MPQSVFWPAVLGGGLAATAGILVEVWKEWRRKVALRDAITLLIKDDLKNVQPIYERIVEDWHRAHIVSFSTTAEFGASRAAYLKNSDWIVFLDDAELRRDLVRYYQKSYEVIAMLETNQRRKYEIERELNQLARTMAIQYGRDYEGAKASAAALMVPEAQELKHTETALPETINRVRDMKAEAEKLLSRL